MDKTKQQLREEALQAARRGRDFLKENAVTLEYVDADDLDMEMSHRCILGQRSGDYRTGAEELGLNVDDREYMTQLGFNISDDWHLDGEGFDYEDLLWAWRRVLSEEAAKG